MSPSNETPAPDDTEEELVGVATKIRRELKDEFQENIKAKHGGRLRGVYREEVENTLELRNYLFEQGIEPEQAIERLEIYQDLMPIEGQLRKLSEKVDDADEVEDELHELNENLGELVERLERQRVQLNRMEHEMSQALYDDNNANGGNRNGQSPKSSQ